MAVPVPHRQFVGHIPGQCAAVGAGQQPLLLEQGEVAAQRRRRHAKSALSRVVPCSTGRSSAYPPARCRYVGEWVAVKLRWRLTVDTAEKSALSSLAAGCPNITITVTQAI